MNQRYLAVAQHAALAAVFFFVLQKFALNQSLETCLTWSLVGAAAAGLLAWQQTSR